MEIKSNFKTVDEYLALQSNEDYVKLARLRAIIRKAAPEATEVISYQMPAYKQNGMVAYFAVSRNHYALYVNPHVMQPFLPRLKQYSLSKSAIRFPLDQDAPEELITEIIQFAIQQNLENKMLKENRKKR